MRGVLDTTLCDSLSVTSDRSVVSSWVLQCPPPIKPTTIRDRPFNLKGGGEGGYGFCSVQNFFFGQHKS